MWGPRIRWTTWIFHWYSHYITTFVVFNWNVGILQNFGPHLMFIPSPKGLLSIRQTAAIPCMHGPNALAPATCLEHDWTMLPLLRVVYGPGYEAYALNFAHQSELPRTGETRRKLQWWSGPCRVHVQLLKDGSWTYHNKPATLRTFKNLVFHVVFPICRKYIEKEKPILRPLGKTAATFAWGSA